MTAVIGSFLQALSAHCEFGSVRLVVTIRGVRRYRQIAFSYAQIDRLRTDQHNCLSVRAEGFERIE